MKKLAFIIMVLFFYVIISSCQREKPLSPRLLQIEQVLEQSPDTAMSLLKQMESPEKLPEEQYAYYCLLLTEAMDKTYTSFRSDSLITVAADYFVKSKNSYLKAKSLYYLGRVNQELLQPEKATEYYLAAIPYAENIKSYKLLAMIYNHIGGLYRQQDMYDKALIATKNSCEYFELAKDTVNLIYAVRDVGRVYLLMKETDSTLVCYQRALNLASLKKDRRAESSILVDIGLANRTIKNYSEALKMFREAIQINQSDNMASVYLSLGSLYTQLGETDSAKTYLQKAQNSTNLYTKAGANYSLYKLSITLGEYKEAIHYNDIYLQVRDVIRKDEQKEEILKLTHRYEQQELKKEMELRRVRERLVYSISILFLLLALIVFTFFYLRSRWAKERLLRLKEKQIQYEKDLRLLSEEQIEENKKQIEINRQKLINKEAALQSIQRNLLDYNTKLLKTENELIALKRGERAAKDNAFRQSGWTERIRLAGIDARKLDSKLMPFMTKDFPELIKSLNEAYANFAIRLQNTFPQLRERELHICYLIKAGAKTGNIATIISMTPNAVTKKKKQILEKMEIIDTNVTLDDFLDTF